jgi:DNA-directed RNA polymerase specialized sigma24 family protein
VAQDERREVDDAGKRAPSPEAARQERLAQLVLCRTKLSASEALLLNEVFPTIVTSHYDRVWNWLRKRGLPSHEAEDLLQEAFLDLHGYILEHGFPDNLPGLLRKITVQKFLDYLRATCARGGAPRYPSRCPPRARRSPGATAMSSASWRAGS